MFKFSIALKYFKSGCKIQHKDWKKDYYIMIKEGKILDSMGNLFYPNVEEYININLVTYDSAGLVWDIYDDDLDPYL